MPGSDRDQSPPKTQLCLTITSSAAQNQTANMSDSPSEGSAQQGEEGSSASADKPCMDLKVAMEKCAAEKGEENCLELIEAYKECMKSIGQQI